MRKISISHVWYWIGYLILITACISTLFFVSDSTLVVSIGFAASIVSIIIGIIAVFITVYQGLTQSSSVEKMQEASDRVENVTKTLEKLGGIIEKIDRIDKSLNDADFKTIHEKLDMIDYSDLGNTGSLPANKISLTEAQFKLVYSYSRIEINFNYYLLKCYESNKPVDVFAHIMHMAKRSKIEVYDMDNALAISGYLVVVFLKYSMVQGFSIDDKYVKSVPSFFPRMVNDEIELKAKETIDKLFNTR